MRTSGIGGLRAILAMAALAAAGTGLDIGFRGGSGSRGRERRSGPGWSNRHVKRMAVKARNVKRHRANVKG